METRSITKKKAEDDNAKALVVKQMNSNGYKACVNEHGSIFVNTCFWPKPVTAPPAHMETYESTLTPKRPKRINPPQTKKKQKFAVGY